MDYLNDMALFVEVVKANSFRGAAEIIGVPSSTLSRRISALEKKLGLRLLHRTTRKMQLTEAGKVYFERCKRIVDEAKVAHEHLSDILVQPSGLLRVSLSIDFSLVYLAPIIAEFAKAYPDITFELDFSPRQVDLITEPYDVAIRMGNLENSYLVSRLLTVITPKLYASTSYLKSSGEPIRPEELKSHECLHLLKNESWTLLNGKEEITVPVSARLQMNNIGFISRLAILGMGIMLTPKEVVLNEIKTGKLQQILPQWHGKPIPVHALTETRLLPAKTSCFITFLQAELKKQKELSSLLIN